MIPRSMMYSIRLDGPPVNVTISTSVDPILSTACTVSFVMSVAPCAIRLKMFVAVSVTVSTTSPMAEAIPFIMLPPPTVLLVDLTVNKISLSDFKEG